MKLTPVSGPLPPPTINETARRAKMINAFNDSAAKQAQAESKTVSQGTTVSNPNAVSVEELSAVKPPSRQVSEIPQEQGKDALPPSEGTAEASKPARDPEIDRRFNELARRERQLRQKAQQQEQQFKLQQQQLAEKEAAIKAKESEYSQGYISKDQLKKDTLKILAENEVLNDQFYNSMTESLLQNQVDPRIEGTFSALRNKIAELENKVKTQETTQAEQQDKQYKAALTQVRNDVKQEIKLNPTAYRHIAATNSVNDVVELIDEVYKKDGIVMHYEDACKEVESYLKDEYSRLKSRLEPAGQPAKVEAMANKQQQPQTKTLTNQISSSRKLTARERAIQRANGFKGEFN